MSRRGPRAEKADAARTKLLAAMDAKLKEVADRGDLDKVKEVKGQRDAFEKDGKLPSSTLLSRAKSDYEAEIRNANEELRKALENAKASYTKALKIEDADAVAAELAKLAAEPKGNAKDKVNDPLIANSSWKGWQRVAGTDGMLDFRLTVEERDGDKFKGEITLADGRTKYNFEGTIKNNKVRFRSEKKGFYNMTWVGELKAGELKLSFSGTNPVGTSVSGAAYLKEE